MKFKYRLVGTIDNSPIIVPFTSEYDLHAYANMLDDLHNCNSEIQYQLSIIDIEKETTTECKLGVHYLEEEFDAGFEDDPV